LTSLDRYILRQCLTPLAFAVVVVTAMVWLTQSLQRIDLIIDNGQGLAMFGWLSILIIPSLLSVILPFAVFAASLYALQRLHSDSEIAVIFSAGVSKMRIAAPLLCVAAMGALFTLWINADLMPRSYRILKQSVAEIRADFATAVLRSGEFTTVAEGFTIYVEESRPGGQFRGLLINDYRNGQNSETYMAQRGLLRETDDGPVLYLVNGNIQRVARDTGKVDFIRFEETAINVGQFNNNSRDFQLELTERYLSELFNPDMSRQWDRKNAGNLIAEGHNRLASPLYSFAFVLIALFALIGGPYNRQGYTVRIALACGGAGALRVSGFVLQGVVARNGAYWLEYLVPVGAIIIFAALLRDRVGGSSKKRRDAAGAA